jgi:hypothetical protein
MDYFSSSKFVVTWVSGIGSLRGILYSTGDGIGEDSYSLLCLHQGESLLYQNSCYSSCCYSTVDVPEKSVEDSPVTIYPSPTYDMLYIDSYYGGYLSLEVTSLNGQLLLSNEIEGTNHRLDLSTFQKGIYFITVRSKDFVTTRKIVKL